MKVTIDRDDCTSCAACWDEYPEIFEENGDDELAQILAKFQVAGDPAKGEVPEDLRDSAQSAADECPAEVIHVEE
jgi:ferredoxin